MKKIGFLLMIVFLSLSCSDEQDCCSQNDTLFEFSVVNQSGEDLLDENTLNSLNTNNIKLFNLINGEEILVNNPNSDSPDGYIIFERDGMNLIRTFFDESSLTVNGIIEWDLNKRDLITLEMDQQSESVKRLIKIEFNSQVVWSEETASNPNNRYFQIVK